MIHLSLSFATYLLLLRIKCLRIKFYLVNKKTSIIILRKTMNALELYYKF